MSKVRQDYRLNRAIQANRQVERLGRKLGHFGGECINYPVAAGWKG